MVLAWRKSWASFRWIMSKSPDSFKFLTGKASPMDIHDRCKGRTTRDISARMTSLVKPFGSFAAGERCQGNGAICARHISCRK